MNSENFQACPNLIDDPTGELPCQHYIRKGFCTLPSYFRCLEYVARKEPTMSYSAVSDYTACHRKFYWRWLKGVETIEKPWPMTLGLYASAILGWLHNVKVPTDIALRRYQAYIDRLIGQTIDPEDETREFGHPDLWKMKAMFDVYVELGYTDLKGIPEYEFYWNIDGLPRFHGFIDLLYTADPVKYDGWEFKWTGDADNFSKFLIGDQLMSYFIADPKIDTMMNRCFLYPKLWQRTKKKPETITDFFERCKEEIRGNPSGHFFDRKYWRHEFDYENYLSRIRRVTAEIMNYCREGGEIEPFYQNKANCFNPWPCDFLRICENDIKEPWTLTEIYRKKQVTRR